MSSFALQEVEAVTRETGTEGALRALAREIEEAHVESPKSDTSARPPSAVGSETAVQGGAAISVPARAIELLLSASHYSPPEARNKKRRQTRFLSLASWEGVVESVEAEVFSALVSENREGVADEIVEFSIEDVSPADRPLLAEGAFFYWSIGYLQHASGQRDRISRLHFRRLPTIRKADVEAGLQDFRELLADAGMLADNALPTPPVQSDAPAALVITVTGRTESEFRRELRLAQEALRDRLRATTSELSRLASHLADAASQGGVSPGTIEEFDRSQRDLESKLSEESSLLNAIENMARERSLAVEWPEDDWTEELRQLRSQSRTMRTRIRQLAQHHERPT